MTEEEFVALLKIEDKALIVQRDMFRGRLEQRYKPVPHYSAYIVDLNDGVEVLETRKPYRSRAYAVQKAIKDYYENR